MTKIGRNAPCPCGSGKKYKHCCLKKQEAAERGAVEKRGAASKAIEWLARHHEEAVREAIEADFLEELGEDASVELEKLPEAFQQMAQINAHEWLLADGELELEDGTHRAIDLLLGRGGPLFTAGQRAWLEAMASRPLRLYEIQDVRRDEGFWVKDLLVPDEPVVWVKERLGSQSTERWGLLGSRLIPVGAHWELSGAAYPFHRDEGLTLLEEIRTELSNIEGGIDSPEAREFISLEIIDRWLQTLTRPPSIPKLVDASTGEPLMLVTDHYQVRDWSRLVAALASQPDVDGDRINGWTRFVEEGTSLRRALLSLNVKEGDRLEAFAKTLRRADEGKAWLQEVAGGALIYRTREMTDPQAVMRDKARRGPSSQPLSKPKDTVPPEIQTRVMQQFVEEHYRHWADQPLPVLNNQTPREAMQTPKGREQVIELLKTYEHGERQQARDQGREPTSYDFLWKALGLKPE